MAGLGAFQGSQTYKTVMGEKEEVAAVAEDDEGLEAEEEEQEEVATEELVEKGTVALSETTTHWLLSVAGTCVHCE